jgi:glycosyltransferase involved in cell wall biosynthesis
MTEKLISICIPSYNRPKEIRRLLDSIDSTHVDDIEIVICEDKSPKRLEVRAQVMDYKASSKYDVNYIENEENCGYDKNLRNLIRAAKGHFVMFMGDDDMFIPQAFDQFFDFASKHTDCGYILRSYRNQYKDGSMQEFRYFNESRTFEPSDETYMSMFDKSVFVSGFTISREYSLLYETDKFDGSLLYQLYLLAEVCRVYPSAYCHTLLTQAIEGGIPYFGNSESEKDLYTPGEITVNNSVNFMRWYTVIIDYIAEKYHNQTNVQIRHNMSKYSYGFVKEQRGKGLKVFTQYCKELKKLGFASSVYFYIYYVGLVLFNVKGCDRLIAFIKRVVGHRPKL